MKVMVQLFAVARDLAGAEAIEIELPQGATVSDLRCAIASQHPSLADMVSHAAIAVGAEYVDDETTLTATDDVAIIPPVSGG